MAECPLTEAEKVSLATRIQEARERKDVLDRYIAEMEQELRAGTAWTMADEDSERIGLEVDEIVRKDREKDELQEIEKYGRLLTELERKRLRWWGRPFLKKEKKPK